MSSKSEFPLRRYAVNHNTCDGKLISLSYGMLWNSVCIVWYDILWYGHGIVPYIIEIFTALPNSVDCTHTICLSARATNPKPRGIKSDNRGSHEPRLVTSSPTIRCNGITELFVMSAVSLPRIERAYSTS